MKRIFGLLLILSLAALACRSATPGKPVETDLSTPAVTAAAASMPPQTANTLSPGNHDLTIEVDGLIRTFILHVPPQTNSNELLPLLIVLHGGGGTGEKMQKMLGFDDHADTRGFLVAYPDAYQISGERDSGRWNDGRGTEESSKRGIDDVKFLLEMIAEIGRLTPLDAGRVYVTGASNGGMMTYRLGCETEGVFAGIAPVIANIPQPLFETCSPVVPLAFVAINGSADPLIPLEGGEVCEGIRFGCTGGWVVSQSESVGLFAKANGCDGFPQVQVMPTMIADGTSVEKQNYLNCVSAPVQAYIVKGGGHTWPPLPGQLPAAGAQSKNLNATRVIVDFFFP